MIFFNFEWFLLVRLRLSLQKIVFKYIFKLSPIRLYSYGIAILFQINFKFELVLNEFKLPRLQIRKPSI